MTPSFTARPRALAALRDMVRAVNVARDLDTSLDLIARKTTDVMHVDSCSIYLLDPDAATLQLRATTGLARRALGRSMLQVGEGMTGHAVRVNRPVYAEDARQDPHFKRIDEAEEMGYCSLLALPLVVDGRPIGAMNVQTIVPHAFSEEEITLLSLIGDLAAGALAKAQLYDRQKQQIDEMARLARENARLMTNVAIVREMHHRIKNNLQTVAMLMQLQLPDADELDTRQVLLTNIQRIRSIAAVHEALSGEGVHLVDVKDVLKRITRMTAESMTDPSRVADLVVLGEPLLLPSREATALTLVVNELVHNALQHAFRDGTAGRVEISLGRSSEELIVLVRDNGVGLPPDHTRGLGLEIAETLVEDDLNGRIRFLRPARGGTEVSIRMPRLKPQES